MAPRKKRDQLEKHRLFFLMASAIAFVSLLASILLHNLLSGLLGIEEPFFFSLVMLLIFVFPLVLFCTAIVFVISLVKKA